MPKPVSMTWSGVRAALCLAAILGAAARGTAAQQPVREYALVDGYAQAAHARAVSNSIFFGRAIITIDYSGYQVREGMVP